MAHAMGLGKVTLLLKGSGFRFLQGRQQNRHSLRPIYTTCVQEAAYYQAGNKTRTLDGGETVLI